MSLWLRLVLWVLVIAVPGGTLLLPVLIRDVWLRRRPRAPMTEALPALVSSRSRL
jgi:hypothetical protein